MKNYFNDNFHYKTNQPTYFNGKGWFFIEIEMENYFGKCGTTISLQTCVITNKNAKWDYWEDIFYFKSENDLIEFKMRFL